MKILNLPVAIKELVNAQNEFDSVTFANQFTNDAIVHDEGKTHNGKKEIENWNKNTNEHYQVSLIPREFSGDDEQGIMAVTVTGNFPGSPIALHYHFRFEEGKIKTLEIK